VEIPVFYFAIVEMVLRILNGHNRAEIQYGHLNVSHDMLPFQNVLWIIIDSNSWFLMFERFEEFEWFEEFDA
jgi:hypothetical protein